MTIKTAGELRGFLAGVLEGIRAGEIDVDEARAISSVAAQITNSLAVEVKTALELQRMGKDGPVAGSMLIASGDAPTAIADAGQWCDQCDKRVTASAASACTDAHCKAKASA